MRAKRRTAKSSTNGRGNGGKRAPAKPKPR
jgi:hypothetical protein